MKQKAQSSLNDDDDELRIGNPNKSKWAESSCPISLPKKKKKVSKFLTKLIEFSYDQRKSDCVKYRLTKISSHIQTMVRPIWKVSSTGTQLDFWRS